MSNNIKTWGTSAEDKENPSLPVKFETVEEISKVYKDFDIMQRKFSYPSLVILNSSLLYFS